MNATTSKFQIIIEKLTPETQAYLLNLANVAQVAEQSVRDEIRNNKPQKTA